MTDDPFLKPLFDQVTGGHPADLFPELIEQAHRDVQQFRRDQGLLPWDFTNRKPSMPTDLSETACGCGCGKHLTVGEVAIGRAYKTGHGNQRIANMANGNRKTCRCRPDCNTPLTEREIAAGRIIHHGHGPKAHSGNGKPESGTLCACGCGALAMKGAAYKWGHSKFGHRKNAPPAPPTPSNNHDEPDASYDFFEGSEDRPDHMEATEEDFEQAGEVHIPVEEVTGISRPAPAVPVTQMSPEQFERATGFKPPFGAVPIPSSTANDPILKAIQAEMFALRRKLKSLEEMQNLRMEMLK